MFGKKPQLKNLSNKPTGRWRRGFTLIELMVVISLMVMLLLTTASLFFTSLLSGSKTNASAQVKAEGDFALSQMEFLLRNAVELVPPNIADPSSACQPDMDAITIKNFDSGTTRLFREEAPDGIEKIASNSGVYLTSGDLELVTGPVFDCITSGNDSVRYITVSFTLRKGTPNVDQERDIVTQTFQTGVNVRSVY